DRVSYEILRDKMELAVEGHQYRDADGLALSTLGAVQTFFRRAAQFTPFRTDEDYRDYVKRIRAMPAMVAATIERLQMGMKSGWMHTQPVLDRVVEAIDAHLVDDPAKSVLLTPVAKMPELAVDAQRAIDNE